MSGFTCSKAATMVCCSGKRIKKTQYNERFSKNVPYNETKTSKPIWESCHHYNKFISSAWYSLSTSTSTSLHLCVVSLVSWLLFVLSSVWCFVHTNCISLSAWAGSSIHFRLNAAPPSLLWQHFRSSIHLSISCQIQHILQILEYLLLFQPLEISLYLVTGFQICVETISFLIN